ncbi:MAG: TM1266 family iron-only hydrogenase system putative regulator [Anaerovoracaceae bacterium]
MTRTALIGIIVENEDAVEELNSLLHEYRHLIIGRMGVPHPQKDLSIISIAVEADQDEISALSGKLGALKGVSTKTIYSKN